MSAFGGIFRVPNLQAEEDADENGERGRIVGLDLDSGVVRIQAAHPKPAPAETTPDETTEDETTEDETTEDEPQG